LLSLLSTWVVNIQCDHVILRLVMCQHVLWVVTCYAVRPER